MPVVLGQIGPIRVRSTPPSLEQRLDVVERQIVSLRREVQQKGELLDTLASPPWKRLWWFIRGYRFYRVGRWYGQTDELR